MFNENHEDELNDMQDETYRENENCLAGMKCPDCNENGSFKIEAKVILYVTDDGADLAENQPLEWDDESICYCDCGKSAPVKEFKS